MKLLQPSNLTRKKKKNLRTAIHVHFLTSNEWPSQMTRSSTSRNSQQIYKRFTPIFSAALSAFCRLELPCAKQETAHIAQQVMLQKQICISVAVIVLSLLFGKSFSASNINSTSHHKHGSFLCRQPMRETEILGEKPTPLFTSWEFSKNQLTKRKSHAIRTSTDGVVLFSRLCMNNPLRQ